MNASKTDSSLNSKVAPSRRWYMSLLASPSSSRSNGLAAKLLDSVEARRAEEVQLERLARDFDDDPSGREVAQLLVGRLRASMDLGLINWCRQVDIDDPSDVDWLPRANAIWCWTCASELLSRRRAAEFAVCDACQRATTSQTIGVYFPAGHLGVNARLCIPCSEMSADSA